MSNPYAKFLNLLPKQIKYIGKIYSIDSDGSVVVDNVSGTSKTNVKGGSDSYSVNDYVFIVDGVIVSKLPQVQTILEESVI